MKPDARVCDVARRYGVKAQQLTTWRRFVFRHGIRTPFSG
ncbi:transposase (plasmid) [Bradyrhizobium japonicum USDA 123]|nr:transposase [Bradyrhizobium japonicum USDA 123]